MSNITDKKHFWYSKEQSKIQYKDETKTKLRVNYAILENGKKVIYTVMSDTKLYESKFDDVVYLGMGKFLDIEYVLETE